MAQELIMPFARQMMLCGYKVTPYYQEHGYSHYGIDVSSIQGGAGKDATVYASGEGKVVAAGWDDKLGGAVCVLYPQVRNHKTGEVLDVIARYMHLTTVSCSAGQSVRAGDKIGIEGKEGTQDYHLHLEFDMDTAWPRYSPQVAGSSFWKKGTDTTVNPSHLLHIGAGQVIVPPTYNPAWLNEEDKKIPEIGVSAQEINDLKAEVRRLRAVVTEYEAERNKVLELVEKLSELLK